MNKCVECGKEIPDEWGEGCSCSGDCHEEYMKKKVKRIVFSDKQLRELWVKDNNRPMICENCIFLSSDSSGDDYCSNEFPICSKFNELSDFINVDYKEDSFPFKKPKRCFHLSFWASSFSEFLSDAEFNNEIIIKAFHSNPSFKEQEKLYFDVVLSRLIESEIAYKELKESYDKLKNKSEHERSG